MVADDGLIDGDHRIHGISELGILTRKEVLHRSCKQFVGLIANEITDDSITIPLQYFIDVFSKKLLYRLTQQL